MDKSLVKSRGAVLYEEIQAEREVLLMVRGQGVGNAL